MNNTDHFARLGLPRRFALDDDTLERQYLARSRAVHPDFHAAGASADLAASLELSAAINEAYNTLKDPFLRAEYLIKLEGGPSAADQKEMPAEFLMEMLEAREQIEESRGDASAIARLNEEFQLRYAALLAEIASHFDAYDGGAGTESSEVHLNQIRAFLNAAKYVRGLIRDLSAE